MIERLARLGFVSKAVIYAVVGRAGAGGGSQAGGRVTDTSGALRLILGQAVRAGDPRRAQRRALRLRAVAAARRVSTIPTATEPAPPGSSHASATSSAAAVYGALGIEAFRLSRGLRGSTGRETEMWTARIMDWPLGVWIVGLVRVDHRGVRRLPDHQRAEITR